MHDDMSGEGGPFLTLSPDEIKAVIRDIKLKVITNELEFKVDEEQLRNTKALSIVRDKFPTAIISGSACLKIFGLLDRPAKDFDLIVDEKPNIHIYKDTYAGEEFFEDTRLGAANMGIESTRNLGIFSFFKRFIFPDKNVRVDFFLNKGHAKYIEYECDGFTYKFHDPFQIFDKKCEMFDTGTSRTNYFNRSATKHLQDVYKILHKLNK